MTDAAPAPDRHSFGRGEPLSVGLEEEVLLVDPDTLRLAHVADRILPRIGLPSGRADHEAFLAQLELRSEPCGSAAEAVAQLGEGRRAARAAGATLMATGLHPDADYGDVELVRSERYARVEDQMRGLIRRTPEAALHVHVGVPDPETAVAVLMGLREALPLLHGLGASSPFWFGIDSGLSSARAAVIRAYPGRGVPPPLSSWDHYLEALEAIRVGGGPGDPTMVWWDARLQPRLGTVELREVDVQSRLDSAAGIASLTRALAHRSVESRPRELAPEQALHWSSFRAARDGLDAEILHRGRLTPLREAARATLAELGGEDPALEEIERIIAEGGGAARQRAAYASGDMPGLLDFLVEETARVPGR
ncbi:MAG: YbdK family carboxylate-amine ligase [Thermoleophilaceae bacterium]|nr:YbdK family carboxylate-amine ligase [Thermoleophilaceae bacterium]